MSNFENPFGSCLQKFSEDAWFTEKGSPFESSRAHEIILLDENMHLYLSIMQKKRVLFTKARVFIYLLKLGPRSRSLLVTSLTGMQPVFYEQCRRPRSKVTQHDTALVGLATDTHLLGEHFICVSASLNSPHANKKGVPDMCKRGVRQTEQQENRVRGGKRKRGQREGRR